MMRSHQRENSETILTSDASGNWGCGAFWNDRWFQYRWSHNTLGLHITAKELLTIACLCSGSLGRSIAGKIDLCRCDNEAIVAIINTGTSKDCEAMPLMRCLFFITAKHNLLLTATHFPGSINILADAPPPALIDLLTISAYLTYVRIPSQLLAAVSKRISDINLCPL